MKTIKLKQGEVIISVTLVALQSLTLHASSGLLRVDFCPETGQIAGLRYGSTQARKKRILERRARTNE